MEEEANSNRRTKMGEGLGNTNNILSTPSYFSELKDQSMSNQHKEIGNLYRFEVVT